MDLITRVKVQLREHLNPLFASYRRSKLTNEGAGSNAFTIISNNCWGGHVYRYFGMPYNSPTVGMYFFAKDYIKFVSSLDKYLKMDLIIIKPEESIHYDELVKEHPESLSVPIGRLGDIEVVFLHSHSSKEALTKWNRRKERMNMNNLIVKMSEMNGCTTEILKAFDKLPFEKKFVFTTRDYGLKSQVIFKEYEGKHEIENDTSKFRKYIDLTNLINGIPFKRNQ